MDPDEARDYADRFPLSDRDMEEDNQILATLLERILLVKRRLTLISYCKTLPCSRLW
jgi:hypothetical protein